MFCSCYTQGMGFVYAGLSFPSLEPCDRNREFDCYSEYERASVVFCWLFTKLGFREIDEKCLNVDGKASHGWQSMGIAHFLGLVSKHKSFFYGKTIENALDCILPQTKDNPKLMLIYCYLRDYGRLNGLLDESIVAEPSYAYKTDLLQGYCWTNEILLRDVDSDLEINKRLPIEKVNATVGRPTSDCNGKCNRYEENLYK